MQKKKPGFRITLNSPAVLAFAFVCVVAQVLNIVTRGGANAYVFSVYRWRLSDPLTYVRCVCHVFGHADWGHLLNNMMYLLILGPMLEEKYGSKNLIWVMLITALVTGVIFMIFFPRTALLGASGIVFAFILLSSITQAREHEIPLTFILVALLYIGEQIYTGVTNSDTVSQITHIAGGAVGTVLGFGMDRAKNSR